MQVGHGEDFLTIKSAISAASPFDCILIHSGVYDEQSVLSLKFPIEIVGADDLGQVVVQMPVEQQSSTARLVNLVLQPGILRSQTSLPVIIKVCCFIIKMKGFYIYIYIYIYIYSSFLKFTAYYLFYQVQKS